MLITLANPKLALYYLSILISSIYKKFATREESLTGDKVTDKRRNVSS